MLLKSEFISDKEKKTACYYFLYITDLRSDKKIAG